MTNNLKYSDITEKIIGAAFEVHKFLGNGFQEVIYQRALAFEMAQAGLTFAREIEQHIFYKDLPKPIGTRRADFVVEGKVLVELKAVSALEDATQGAGVKLFESISAGSRLVNQFWVAKFEISQIDPIATKSKITQIF